MSYTTPFADLTWADVYFEERTNADRWTGSNEAGKNAALKQATRDILRHASFYDEEGRKLIYSATNAPDELKEACCEQALYLLTVNRLDAYKNTRSGIASAKGVLFDRDAIPASLGCDCVDILTDMGAEIDAAAFGGGISIGRLDHLQM